MFNAWIFGVLALLLTGPVPALLARAHWPIRAPRAALVLWQAIAIAAVLSAFSCGLAIASNLLVPGPDGRPTTEPTREIAALGVPVWITLVIVFGATLLVGARLIYSIIQVGIRTRQRRAYHRAVVDLMDCSEDAITDNRALSITGRVAADLRVIEFGRPVAYCLPGLKHRVVLSQSALEELSPRELEAVLAHERSHLRARHDLVIEAFTAVHHAFPRFVRSDSALISVQLLIELLADDHAVRASGRQPLAQALVACAGSSVPRGAMAVGGQSTLIRVERLTDTRPNHVISALAYAAAAVIVAGPTIAVAIPWVNELRALFFGG